MLESWGERIGKINWSEGLKRKKEGAGEGKRLTLIKIVKRKAK